MQLGILAAMIAACLFWAQPGNAQETLLPDLRAAARKLPDDYAAQLALGRGLIRAGHLPEAEAQMTRVVRTGRGSIEALYAAAEVQFAAADSRRARTACSRLLQKNPEHVLSQVCMARAFLAWRRSSQAEEHVARALHGAPSDPAALLVLADLRRTQGNLEAAAVGYEKTLAQAPANAAAELGLGLTLALQDKPAQAVAALRKALQLDPQDPAIQFELGQRLSGAEAVRLLQAAVDGRPHWSAAELMLAQAQLQVGDAGSAAARLRALLAGDPNNGLARAGLGNALMELGKSAEAETELRKAVELMPNDYDASFALARLYERTGRHEEAFTQYRHTADLKRESIEPMIAAAELGLSLKRPLLAAALLDRALARAPRSARALALYGDSLVARDEIEAAREFYRRALTGEGPLDRKAVQKTLDELK
jgi:tetratricopeptide (TPR) repeat protein